MQQSTPPDTCVPDESALRVETPRRKWEALRIESMPISQTQTNAGSGGDTALSAS